MVELMRAGRGISDLAREFGCNASSIHAWMKAGGGLEGSGAASIDAPLSMNERQELIELRRKLKQVQQERDILAKATAWFAGKSEKTGGLKFEVRHRPPCKVQVKCNPTTRKSLLLIACRSRLCRLPGSVAGRNHSCWTTTGTRICSGHRLPTICRTWRWNRVLSVNIQALGTREFGMRRQTAATAL